MCTYYTAVGNFRRKRDSSGQTYPVIIVNRKEYMVDRQEMALWTCLNWRITNMEQAREHYEKLEQSLHPYITRTLENCLKRLEVRGLVVSGNGDTDFEALYDLSARLYHQIIAHWNGQLSHGRDMRPERGVVRQCH